MSLSEILNDMKVAYSVSIVTWSSGLATFLEWIPADIGKLATLIGIILSLVLIYTHLKRTKLEEDEHKIKMKLLNKQLKDKEDT